MIHIKINQNNKLVLFKSNNKLSEEYDNIFRISNQIYVFTISNEFSLNYYFFDIDKNQIALELLNTSLNFYSTHFVYLTDGYFYVYSSLDLSILYNHKIGKNKYNFTYLGNNYCISDDCLFENENNLGIIDQQMVIHSSYHKKLVQFRYQILWNKAIIIKELASHTFTEIYDDYPKNNLVVFYSKENSSIYLNSNKVFCGKIDSHNFNYGAQIIKWFTSENKSYIVIDSTTLYGPFNSIILQNLDLIYRSTEKMVFFGLNTIFIYDILNKSFTDKSVTINDLKYVNKATLYLKDIEISLLKDSNNVHYYYNNENDTIAKLDSRDNILPYIGENKIYWFDKNIKLNVAETKLTNYELIDYTYFKDDLFIILKNNEEYILYKTKSAEILKKYKKFVSFTYHKNCLIQIDPKPGKRLQLDTIDYNLKKVNKINLKADSVEKSIITGEVKIDFETKYSMPSIYITSDESLHIDI
jgi:hypothetical protein